MNTDETTGLASQYSFGTDLQAPTASSTPPPKETEEEELKSPDEATPETGPHPTSAPPTPPSTPDEIEGMPEKEPKELSPIGVALREELRAILDTPDFGQQTLIRLRAVAEAGNNLLMAIKPRTRRRPNSGPLYTGANTPTIYPLGYTEEDNEDNNPTTITSSSWVVTGNNGASYSPGPLASSPGPLAPAAGGSNETFGVNAIRELVAKRKQHPDLADQVAAIKAAREAGLDDEATAMQQALRLQLGLPVTDTPAAAPATPEKPDTTPSEETPA